MKVTALLPDDLIMDVRKLTGGGDITDSILIALRDYVAHEKMRIAIRSERKAALL